jgi:hypothetical protein
MHMGIRIDDFEPFPHGGDFSFPQASSTKSFTNLTYRIVGAIDAKYVVYFTP